ncbi:MAG TPA: SRPBCC domain-containing protein [Enteractinococcus sp.]
MATPTPTGRLVSTEAGQHLILERSLPVGLQEAWTSLTDAEQTAKWIGRWEGNGHAGETIRLQLGFEDDAPWADVRIIVCEAPNRLRVVTLDAEVNTAWDLAVELTEGTASTDLVFTMYSVDPSAVEEIGPGWEYYLDQLMASLTGAPMPAFEDYYPGQQEYYRSLAG